MRRFVLWALALGLLAGLAACGGKGTAPTAAPAEQSMETQAPEQAPAQAAVEPAKEIVFFNWSEYIDPEVYDLFEQETGIKVIEDNFSSNEELLAKLKGGVTGYAVIVPSDYMVNIMIQEGLLAELNHDNIPNLKNLAEEWRNVPFDPGNKYCVPYQWGTTGIGYLSDQIDEPQSWAVLFDPNPDAPWYGRATMLDDARESFAAALIYLGYDPNTTDEAQLQEARDLLIKAKAGLSGYDSDTYEDLLASGENLLAHGWSGDFLVAQEDNENIAYTIPQEGGVIWVDNLCIPMSASPEEKLAGEMFINFILRPDIGAKISEYNYYASPNAEAEKLLPEDFLNDPTVYPPQEVRAKLHFLKPVGEAEALYQRLWDEVKAAP